MVGDLDREGSGEAFFFSTVTETAFGRGDTESSFGGGRPVAGPGGGPFSGEFLAGLVEFLFGDPDLGSPVCRTVRGELFVRPAYPGAEFGEHLGGGLGVPDQPGAEPCERFDVADVAAVTGHGMADPAGLRLTSQVGVDLFRLAEQVGDVSLGGLDQPGEGPHLIGEFGLELSLLLVPPRLFELVHLCGESGAPFLHFFGETVQVARELAELFGIDDGSVHVRLMGLGS